MDEVRRILGSQRGKSILKFSNSNDETWQIDWQKVRQDTERFALSLRNSTKVVTAFKTSLEEEKNTLVDLLTSSFTTYETDGKVARVVSAKTYEKLLKDDDDIGVNAFGEKLYNINGEEVDYIKDGIAYDKNGVALQEQQLKVSGKIYNEIEKRLAEINKKLSEATSAENLRKILDAEAQRANDGRITYAVSRNLNSEQAAYVYRNADIVNKEFQNVAKRALEIEMLDESSYDTFNEFNDALARGENEARALAAIFADEVRKILFGTSGIYSEDVVREANQRTDESRRKEFADNFKNTLLGEGELFTGGSNNYSAGRILEALGFSRDTNLSSLMSELGDTQVNELLDKFEIKATTAEERLNGLTQALAKDFLEKQMKELSKQASDLVFDTLWEGWQSPFKTMGDYLLFLIDKTKTWSDVWDDLGSSMQTIAGNLVSQTGQLAQNAGLALVQSGAMQQNYGMIVGGLALAAAGGFASSFGNAIANYNKNNSDKDKESKLQSITDQIKNLLEQARKDALYYEKNLQHRTALGINEKFSYTSVNDAVITPKGQVIKTNPSDYLIATKTPQTLGGTVVQPNISFNVIDNVGVKVKTEQKVNADGSIELQAILLNVMDDYISSSKSDEAFTARQYRLQGHTSIM